jgi:hypothetical protein
MFKAKIPNVDGSGSLALIIPQPTMTRKPHLLVGHWTHACPAFDLVNEKPVMIMDSWRVSLPEFLLEGETYKLYNVSNIANRIAYHDVRCTPLYPSAIY